MTTALACYGGRRSHRAVLLSLAQAVEGAVSATGVAAEGTRVGELKAEVGGIGVKPGGVDPQRHRLGNFLSH